MKKFAVLVLMFGLNAFAQEANNSVLFSEENMASVEELRAASDVYVKGFDANIFDTNSWINEFPLVIVINKANSGRTKQTLRLFKNGELIYTTKVSTGREQWEKKKVAFWKHGPKNSYFSSTNTGYFRVQWQSQMHKSKLWGTYMPYASFFDGGIAIHQAPGGTEGKLGSRASGGCVRASQQAAAYIFAQIQAAGQGPTPSFNRDGSLVLDANGNPRKFNGYRTLVIVENIVE